jgi:hypothetical protein
LLSHYRSGLHRRLRRRRNARQDGRLDSPASPSPRRRRATFCTLAEHITRYIPGVDPSGRISSDENWATLRRNEVVSEMALLQLSYASSGFWAANYSRTANPNWPGDSARSNESIHPAGKRPQARTASDEPIELKVYLNGKKVYQGKPSLNLGMPETLTITVDTRDLIFPNAPGEDGVPNRGVNTVLLVPATGCQGICPGEDPCFYQYHQYTGQALAWASIEFRAMAPLLLIHGVDADRRTWSGPVNSDLFPEHLNVVRALRLQLVPFDSDISLGENDSVIDNGGDLTEIVRERAGNFGAKEVHLVAHSKGGVDAREYLAKGYRMFTVPRDGIRVRSLTTLSTPHHGSVLADIQVLNRAHDRTTSSDGNFRRFLRADTVLNAANKYIPFFGKGPESPALEDMTTTIAALRNQSTAFPAEVKLFTMGANANSPTLVNGELPDKPKITAGPPTGPDEAEPIAHELGGLLPPQRVEEVATALYTILFKHTRIRILTATIEDDRVVLEIDGEPDTTTHPNDLVVSDDSAQYPGAVSHYYWGFPASFANHATIKRAEVIGKVLENIRYAFPLF